MPGLQLIGSVPALLELLNHGANIRISMRELKKAQNRSEILQKLTEQVTGIVTSAEAAESTLSWNSLTEVPLRECIKKATALQIRLGIWQLKPCPDGGTDRFAILRTIVWQYRERQILSHGSQIKRSMQAVKSAVTCKHLAEGTQSTVLTASRGLETPSSAQFALSRLSVSYNSTTRLP